MCCKHDLHIFLFLAVALLTTDISLFHSRAAAQDGISQPYVIQPPEMEEVDPSEIEAKVADRFEPDDLTDQARPVAVQIDDGKVLPQVRTFHTATDRDWIYFYGLKLFQYQFFIEVYTVTELDNKVRMSLFDSKGVNNIWGGQDLKNGSYAWQCSQNGYYTLQLEPVFVSGSVSPADANALIYRFWMHAMPPACMTLSGGVYGRVINQEGNGINRIRISVKNGADAREDMTDSLGEFLEYPLDPSRIDGWFFIDGLNGNSSYELTVSEEGDPNSHLIPPFSIDLMERNIARIGDIRIDQAVAPPFDPNDTLFYLEILYDIWQGAVDPNGIFPKWLDTNDLDGFVNIDEFLNGTHPCLYTIGCSVSPQLVLLPFYLDDPYTANDFCVQFLDDWQSIRGYDRENKRWLFWDANARGENFTLQYGTGYMIYKQIPETIYQELQSWLPSGIPEIVPGINICPVPYDPQTGPYSSYEYIHSEDPNGVTSISRSNNAQGGKGAWESAYMFFGRPAGGNFPLSPDGAYVIGVKE